MIKKSLKSHFFKCLIFSTFFIGWQPVNAVSEIIWSGDFETGNFSQWKRPNESHPYWLVPEYGRPAPFGNRSLLEIVTSPVRHGTYAAKFTVKNFANGSEPADCDVTGCNNRRTEVSPHRYIPDIHNALPNMSERWISVSHYLPSDWDTTRLGDNWNGIVVFQIKARNEGGSSPGFAILMSRNGWLIYHRWDDTVTTQSNPIGQIPWQQQMYYNASTSPSAGDWSGGLVHFPNVNNSRAALANVNRGGWTDWILHVKFDARGSNNKGAGFLNLYKREDDDDWVHVLKITPGQTTRGGQTFNHGIMYNAPAGGNDNGGFGIQCGMYAPKDFFGGLPKNRVIYIDNIRIGNEHANFDTMSLGNSIPRDIEKVIIPPENLRVY